MPAPLLDDDEVKILLDYVAKTRKLIEAVETATHDMHLGYDTALPLDARIATAIGGFDLKDMRRVERLAREAKRLLGKRRAITGVKVVTLAYETN